MKFRLLATILLFCNYYYCQNTSIEKKIDSLKLVIKKANHDSIKINAYKDWDELIYTANQNLDLELNLIIAEICQKNLSNKKLNKKEDRFFKHKLSESYNVIGGIYDVKGDYIKALKYFTKRIEISKSINDTQGIGRTTLNIGNLYYNKGDASNAIKYYTNSLQIAEKVNDTILIATAYLNISNVNVRIKNYDNGLYYAFKGLGLYEKINDKYQISQALNNIGNAYDFKQVNDSALFYFEKSLKIKNELNDKYGAGLCLTSIGRLYQIKKDYKKAKESYDTALAYLQVFDAKPNLATLYLNISNFFIETNNTKKAKEYIAKVIQIENETKFLSSKSDAYFLLYTLYKKEANYKNALETHEIYIRVRDSISNETNQKEVMNQELKYNYEKKSLADSLNFVNQKNITDLKHEAELKVEKQQRYALYGGLTLVLIFSAFIFNRFKVTARQKKIIESQKQLIVESINYSKKIQDSLLPPSDKMKQVLPELLLFYKPKDIVSGDFYWYKQFESFTLIACVDCTGHGVPGSFMSTLGNLLLDKVTSASFNSTGDILNNLSNEIIRILNQQNGGEIQDGMDLSICLIDKKNNTIEFSGARNGIIIISEGVAKRYKADLLPVGGNYMKKDKPIERNFKSQIIKLKPNDWVYMYTDGFMEQIGGNDNLPMNYNQFETILMDTTALKSNDEKLNYLTSSTNSWKNNNQQDDDILILGFSLN